MDVTQKELAYNLVYVSSQDDYEIDSATVHSRDFIYGKGWICEKFARYPQDLVIRLAEISYVKEIMILSHHFFVAKSVHVFVGLPVNSRNQNPVWDEANYNEMGEAPFRNTSETSKQIERKTIYVNAKALFIKLRFDEYHKSPVNKTGQVGIMGIKAFGHDRNPRTLTMDPYGDGGTVEPDFSDGEGGYIDEDDFYAVDIVRKDRQKAAEKQKKKEADELKKLSKKDQEYMKVIEVDGRKMRPPTYVDLDEFDELVNILEKRKEEAIYERRYLDAKELKTIIGDLKVKKKKARDMIDELAKFIDTENYVDANQLQNKYDVLRFNTTKEYKHLPRFLDQPERHHYIDNFGKRERAAQNFGVDPTREEGQSYGDVVTRHYYYDPTRPGASEGSGQPSYWGTVNDNPNESVSESNGRISEGLNDERPLHTGGCVAVWSGHMRLESYPDENRVQKIINMDARKDPALDPELDSLVREMERERRSNLDYRVEMILYKNGKQRPVQQPKQPQQQQQPQIRAPAPQVRAPAPQVRAPAPQVRAPAPQIRAPAPQIRAPAPQRVQPTPVKPATARSVPSRTTTAPVKVAQRPQPQLSPQNEADYVARGDDMTPTPRPDTRPMDTSAAAPPKVGSRPPPAPAKQESGGCSTM